MLNAEHQQLRLASAIGITRGRIFTTHAKVADKPRQISEGRGIRDAGLILSILPYLGILGKVSFKPQPTLNVNTIP